MRAQVEACIEVIRPALQADHGDIELIDVDEATVEAAERDTQRATQLGAHAPTATTWRTTGRRPRSARTPMRRSAANPRGGGKAAPSALKTLRFQLERHVLPIMSRHPPR